MADKDDDFDMKELYPETVRMEAEKEEKEAALQAEAERREQEGQGQGSDETGDEGLAQPLPEPRPDGEMAQDASAVMHQTDEARRQQKLMQHMQLEAEKYENRQNGKQNDNMRQDFDNANER